MNPTTNNNNNIKQPSLKKNVFLNYIYQFFVAIIPLITTPYISRVLLNEGTGANIGISSYTSSLVGIFAIVAGLGTVFYGTREIARKRDDKSTYSKLFFEIELLSIFSSFITLIVWLIFSTVYVEYRIYLYVLSLNILAVSFDISWLYIGLEKFEYTVGINALFKTISSALIFIFVKNPSHLWIYMLITTSGGLLGNMSLWLFLPKIIKKEKIEFSNLKTHLQNSFFYFIPAIATTIYTILDKTLIGLLIPGYANETLTIKIAEIENGYYEQAHKILLACETFTFFVINNVMYSRISNLYEKGEHEKIKSYFEKTLHLTLNLSFGSMFGLIISSSIFVPLYFGPGYEKTILLLSLISVLIPIICLSYTLGSIYYIPYGKRKQTNYYVILGATINIILNIPLIIFLKSVGAVISSIVAELVISFLFIYKSNSFLTFRELFIIMWRKIIAGLVMLGLLFGMTYFFDLYLKSSLINNIFKLITIVASGIIIYEATLLILKDKSIIIIKDILLSLYKKIKRNK